LIIVTLADAVQGGLALLQQLGDLVQLQAEGAALEPPGQQPGRDGPDGQRYGEPERVRGQVVVQRGGDRLLAHAHRDLADHDPVRPVERGLRVGRGAGAPVVGADVRPAVHGHDRLGDLLADQRRVRMRVPHPVHVDHHDVGGVGLVPHPGGDLLDVVAAGPALGLQAGADLRDPGHGLRDRGGPLLVLAVQLGPLLVGEQREAQQDRRGQDRELADEDLAGELAHR